MELTSAFVADLNRRWRRSCPSGWRSLDVLDGRSRHVHPPDLGRRYPRNTAKSRRIARSVQRASRAARRARRGNRLHRRGGADGGRRRAVDGAAEPHPRDRRGRICSRSSSRTSSPAICSARSSGSDCSIRPIRPASSSRRSAATSPNAQADRARSSTGRRSGTCWRSRRCCRPERSCTPDRRQ